MKKHFFIFFITIASLSCYAQISFEKGYYINESNEKIDCLIKNTDWKNNPTQFEYKQSESSVPKTLTIETIKEFGIYSVSKYNRFTVNIDRSSANLDDMSYEINPIFKKEQLFLKVLIEGKANLYLYEDGNLRRFFYKTPDVEIEQLVYKSYRTNNSTSENNKFRQQLWTNLKSPQITLKEVKRLNYNLNDLLKIFIKYNELNNSSFTNFNSIKKKDLFNLNLRLGLNSSSLSISSSSVSGTLETKFDTELGFRIGVEAEFVLPFNKNKWAIIIEPTYQNYYSETISLHKNRIVDYTSIEIPIGVRHYFFLNKNSKIFLNGSYVLDFSFNSTAMDLDISSTNNFAIGMGYNHNKKYSLEMRYQTQRNIFMNYMRYNSEYTTISIILGYSIF